jgi:N-acetylglucosamine malate deacetylase 1
VDTCDCLVFSAHPDDAERHMGGTMAKLVSAGYSLRHIVLTSGQMASRGSPEQRIAELRAASAILGCSCEVLDFQDTRVEDSIETRLAVAKQLRRFRPKIVFAPYPRNSTTELDAVAHVDHSATGSAVLGAIKLALIGKTAGDFPAHRVRALYWYMLPYNVTANIVVDVTADLPKALAAIEAHESQILDPEGATPLLAYLRERRLALGKRLESRYAEGFVLERRLQFECRHFFEL